MPDELNPTPTDTPTPAPEPTATPEPKVDDPKNKGADEVAELKAKLAAAEADKAKLEKEKSDEAEKKRLAELSAEEKAKELEKKLAEKDREAMIGKVRLAGGFTDKVFDHFTPSGATEDEVKSSFEGFKSSLDAYKAPTAQKPGLGTPANFGAGSTDGKNPHTGPRVPLLLREGHLKPEDLVSRPG